MSHSKHVVSTAITAETIADSHLVAPEAVALYALGLGDDALILAQRLGEWIAHAPELEEDVALGNIGLDQLGHARSFLTYAGTAWNKSEDDLAYFRTESEFRNRHIFEQPNGDFAVTIARQFFVSLYFDRLYRALKESTDPTLAAIAAKATKEVDYHLDHSVQWLLRLGLGTTVSHEKMQRAVDAIWPFVGELFSPEPALRDLDDDVGVRPELLRESFEEDARRRILDAGLEVPTAPFARGGGRDGIHTEVFGHLLAEMQVLARAHPGATW
ncbi:MAG: ring,2-phenylacetyl-CoA epoxidase subunit PaaC [Actinomycetota bacterium]|nr:ring,2-phenylacetyl-CoA epoxidase subunit PaaC [Actinomycetota bacterium]